MSDQNSLHLNQIQRRHWVLLGLWKCWKFCLHKFLWNLFCPNWGSESFWEQYFPILPEGNWRALSKSRRCVVSLIFTRKATPRSASGTPPLLVGLPQSRSRRWKWSAASRARSGCGLWRSYIKFWSENFWTTMDFEIRTQAISSKLAISSKYSRYTPAPYTAANKSPPATHSP